MRRIIASILLSTYLLANTELHELVKVGFFMEHFAQHQKQNPEITLLDFVILHYFSGNVVDADHAQDMQLPFKTSDGINSNLTVTILFLDVFSLKPAPLLESEGLPDYDQSALPSLHSSDIWQPPKSS